MPVMFIGGPTGVTVTDTISGSDSGGSSHTISLPASTSGKLIVLFIAINNSGGFTWPAGWTEMFDAATTLSGAYRYCDGSEGASIIVTSGSSPRACAWAGYAFTGVPGSQNPEAGTAATGTSTSPDPPSLSPSWGGANNYWIAVAGGGSNAALQDISAYPASYTESQLYAEGTAGGANDGWIASALRRASGASENPAAMTIATSDDWAANTVAVRG